MVKICQFLIASLVATVVIPDSRSQAASLILHHTSFDGGLYWTSPIARLQLDGKLQINISPYHETKYDSFENSIISQWKIAGLETYIIRESEGRITWHSPTAEKVTFKTSPSLNQKHMDSEGCRLIIESEEKYVVTDKNSRQWHYWRGELEKVRFEKGGELLFKSENGLINEIKRDGKVIFHTRLSDDSLLFFAEALEIASIGYDAGGRLINSITFGKSGRPPLRFNYEKCCLAAISEGDKLIRKFSWRKTSVPDMWFTGIRNPMYLYSDGYYKYRHKFFLGVMRLVAIGASGQVDEKTLNLKTGLITVKRQQRSPK